MAPLIYLSNPSKYTLALALKMFSDPDTGFTNWGNMFAILYAQPLAGNRDFLHVPALYRRGDQHERFGNNEVNLCLIVGVRWNNGLPSSASLSSLLS